MRSRARTSRSPVRGSCGQVADLAGAASRCPRRRGWPSPASTLVSVVLPAPLRPTSPTRSPAATRKVAAVEQDAGAGAQLECGGGDHVRASHGSGGGSDGSLRRRPGGAAESTRGQSTPERQDAPGGLHHELQRQRRPRHLPGRGRGRRGRHGRRRWHAGRWHRRRRWSRRRPAADPRPGLRRRPGWRDRRQWHHHPGARGGSLDQGQVQPGGSQGPSRSAGPGPTPTGTRSAASSAPSTASRPTGQTALPRYGKRYTPAHDRALQRQTQSGLRHRLQRRSGPFYCPLDQQGLHRRRASSTS